MAIEEPFDTKEFEEGAFRESLLIMHRQTPNAVIGHIIASAFVAYALSPVIPVAHLLAWWLPLVIIATGRFFASRAFVARWPIADDKLRMWSRALNGATLLQTTAWGMAAIVIWPEEIEYRAFITAILLGIVAAGGVMLAVHRNSFTIYCLPVAVPVVFQLIFKGGRLEWILAALILIYCVLLLTAIHRLANTFIDGLVVKLQMQALSRIDPLTGLANRRGYDVYLEEMWQNAMRSGQPLGLIAIDVDNFKAYNDSYGHPKVDEALREVARLLTQAAGRGTDLCARTGGEEFAIVLPSTDLDGSGKIAEVILGAFHSARIEHAAAPGGILSVSLGVTSLIPSRAVAQEAFINAADQALYKAKRAGKDRIESEVA